MQDTPANPPIRDAATVVVLRRIGDEPCVLMGQRGAKAAFMPNKFVFPGGAVDAEDHNVPLGAPLLPQDHSRLSAQSTCPPNALAAAALRELWEETGQIMGTPSPPDTPWAAPPQSWADFARGGQRPNAAPLRFFFRAVTPQGRPRRFDARFFIADAAALTTNPDDFSNAEDELRHLQWVPLSDVRRFDLPFITEVVLAEVCTLVRRGGADAVIKTVPFFENKGDGHQVRHL